MKNYLIRKSKYQKGVYIVRTKEHSYLIYRTFVNRVSCWRLVDMDNTLCYTCRKLKRDIISMLNTTNENDWFQW